MIQRRLDFQRIARRLAEMNLTMEAFKDAVSIDVRTVERIFSGKTKNAQLKTVEIIADFLRLLPQDILFSVAPTILPIQIHLPITGEHLIGREQELARLQRAWSHKHRNIVSIIAWGGVGKSTLVKHWLGRLARDGWPGVEQVFGWTFHSQGTHDTLTSAEEYIEAALHFFGDSTPRLGLPVEKGLRLARLVGEKRALLVLDGLEPLQHPPGPQAGQVTDPALAAFLHALALANAGLCILTSRIAVADIATFHSTTVEVLSLEELGEEAGAEFLRVLGCQGSKAERRAAAHEFGGHALALHLLGTYIRDVCGGDLARRREIASLDNWSMSGGQVWRVMASYERWLGHGPEVAVLRLLGLFDRTASAEEIAALRMAPAIPELTETLLPLHESKWLQALRRLRLAGLLAPVDPDHPHAVDAHPLIREYYRHQLREHFAATWKAGHERLYQALRQTPLEVLPQTLQGLLPLYAAVVHGCLAGQEKAALYLFRDCIRRGEDNFSIERLGAFGADLSTLSHFFKVMWGKVAVCFDSHEQLFLFYAVGECLSALGRVAEAQEPLHKALTLANQQEDWTMAALSATKLSEVYRARGDLLTAVSLSRRSVTYTSHAGVPLKVQLLSQAFLGFSLYWTGDFADAERTFQQAEHLQQLLTPQRPILHSVIGYMYDELLLDRLEQQIGEWHSEQFLQEWERLQQRLRQTLDWAEADRSLCDLGLQHISMGRLYFLARKHQDVAGKAENLAKYSEYASTHLTCAMEFLRDSNHRNYFPRALLTRATGYRLEGRLELASKDIQEVLKITLDSAMEFYQTDAYLEKASIHLAIYRNSLDEKELLQAAGAIAKSKTLIHMTGYYRRSHQLTALKALLDQNKQG